MREATGELSSSVIVIGLIAALAAFFFLMVWPYYRQIHMKDESCANAVCDIGHNAQGMATCYSPGDSTNTFECPYRG